MCCASSSTAGSTCRAAPRPTRSMAACSRSRPQSACACCATAKARRASSSGRFCATASTTQRCTWERLPTTRVMWTRPCAGASACSKARSSCGRRPAGWTWRRWCRKTSTRARRCATRRCPSGCSRVRWPRRVACTRPKARGARPRANSSRAAHCPSTRASPSPRRCAARPCPISAPPARRCSRTTRSACGRWTTQWSSPASRPRCTRSAWR